MIARRLLIVLSLVVVAAAVAFWVYPYVRAPALTKNPWAISSAFGDAVIQAVGVQALRTDAVREGRQVGAATYDHVNPPLCVAEDLRGAKYPPTNCLVVNAHVDDPKCENAHGCAHLRVHQSLARDPQILQAIKEAIAAPCDQLPPASALPAGRGSEQLHGLANSTESDRIRLGCQGRPLKGRDLRIDSRTGSVIFQF